MAKEKGDGGHVVKSDVRHKYKVTELVDFSRQVQTAHGVKMMPRLAVLTPMDGGKQVQAYVPGNLEDPLDVGCVVMVRPHERKGKNEGPSVKFRITNVLESRGLSTPQISAGENAQLGQDARADADTRV
jgi:hypothetical protein